MSSPLEPAGLFAALKNAPATLLGMGRTRLELLSNELEVEKLRLLRHLALAIAVLIFSAFGILLLVLLATLLFWEQRVWVVGLFAVVFFALAAWFYRSLKRSLGTGDAPFGASLSELQKDLAALKKAAGQTGTPP